MNDGEESSTGTIQDQISEPIGRRRLFEALGGSGGGFALRRLVPLAWVTPIALTVALPAHAACSLVDERGLYTDERGGKWTKPADCRGHSGGAQNGTVSGSVGAENVGDVPAGTKSSSTTAITASRSNAIVTLTITPPPEVVITLRPFALVELVGGKPNVMRLFVSHSAATPTTMSFSRTKGSYEYQLRWPGGYATGATVEVP